MYYKRQAFLIEYKTKTTGRQMNALFKVISFSTSLALTTGSSLSIKSETGSSLAIESETGSSLSIGSESNPLAITEDVLDALHAVEDAAEGEIDQVCYKDA